MNTGATNADAPNNADHAAVIMIFSQHQKIIERIAGNIEI